MWWIIFYAIVTLFWAYIIKTVFFTLPKHVHGVYGDEGLYLIYWWRWVWRVFEIWIEKKSSSKRMNNYEVRGDLYYDCGIVPTPSEQELERPKPLITDRHEDSMQFFGVDKEGRALVAKLVRQTQRRASVVLVIVDKNGQMCTLPFQPDTNILNVSDGGWKAGGLTMQCVEPMRCWRLKFNGLLRRGVREEYVTEDEEDSDAGEVIHARFDFLWRALRSPVDTWRDASPRLLAHAFAHHSRTSPSMFSLVDSMSLEIDEYEQWGSLHGEVKLGESPSEDPQEWFLRGCRRHRWGLNKTLANFHRSVEILTYFSNGDVCSLQTSSYGTKMSHYVLGYMQKASGQYHPITSTNLSLSRFDEIDKLPHDVLTRFKAGGQKYDMWHKLGPGVTLHTGDPWTLTHKVNFNSAAITHTHGWGLTIFSDRYHDLCPVPEHECLSPLDEPVVEVNEGSPLIVTFSNYLCRAPSLTGGKGASLAQLSMLKDVSYHPFEVSNGIVVTASSWNLQLKLSTDLQQAIRVIEQAVGSSSQQQIIDACGKAVEVFENTAVCSEVKNAVRDSLLDEFDGKIEEIRFAVRSSGCAEDGEETSAAGQNKTILAVKGMDNIYKAIADCWASQFTYQSVEYRRQRGQDVNGGMGVVVQEMVNADVAGVIFTLDPVTGNPSSITINANYGLGESVVSATTDPDTVIVRRTWRDHLSIASVTRGAKKTKFIMNEDRGTSEVTVSEAEKTKFCISNAMALRLANLAVYLQKAYGSARDIEFAVVSDTVYLLQARPITGLDSWTDFELIHEQDSNLLTDHELITKANTGEVFSGSTSPLAISVVIPCLDYSYQRDLVRVQYPAVKFEPHYYKLCPSYFKHVFLNMIEVQYRDNEGEVNLTSQAIDLAVHGHFVTTEEYIQYGKERFGTVHKFSQLLALCYLAYDKFTSNKTVSDACNQFGKFDFGLNRFISADSLYAEITRRLPELLQVSSMHVVTSKVSSGSQAMALIILAEGNKEFQYENHADMAALLSSCVGVESADVPLGLKHLARVIAENEEVNDFLSMTCEEGKVWLESHPGLVGNFFRAFLEKHGHRCIKELDLSSRSWCLDPKPLIESLQAMVQHSDSYNSVKEEISVEHALANLHTQVKDSTKRVLRIILPMCRGSIVNREATKSLLTKVIDGFRKAYLKLGELMVGEARLPDADLIFFLKHQEIGELLETRSPTLIAKAVRRKRLDPQLDTLRFADISSGLPRPLSASVTRSVSDGADLVMSGTPVCQGVVTATARVVTKLSEANTIQNGDILVTICTDVGWTPYFPLLSGVITEIGGLISHGAVVAREYGLPCVVGAGGATQLLQSGDTIVLNATQGSITRIYQATNSNESR